MIAKNDFQCKCCQTLTMKGEEYGTAWNYNTDEQEMMCILCIQAAEMMRIPVIV